MKISVEKYFDDIVDFAQNLIRFNSTLAESAPGAPFGKGCAECLEYFLNTAKDMGFEVKNYDNYIGEVIWGEGEEFAILAHLDVVPAGDGWKYPPFGAEINDDISDGGTKGAKIWGRGAIDDKAPLAATLYAMKALRDAGYKPSRKYKLIVGCNEETGWACIEHYNKCATMPREGFTPDANFPVIYAESGILHISFKFQVSDIDLASLAAGTAINMVPALAVAKYKDGKVFTEAGKSAHASHPEYGENAIQKLLLKLSRESEEIKRIYNLLFSEKFGLSNMEDRTGKLTFSPDLASYKEGELTISVDIRYPALHTLSEVTEEIDKYGVEYKITDHKAPLYNDPDGPLVSTLARVYNETTESNLPPVSIGGGTYARALECGCGYGPDAAGMECTAHAPNEFVTLEHIKMMFNVYQNAIYELSEIAKK